MAPGHGPHEPEHGGLRRRKSGDGRVPNALLRKGVALPRRQSEERVDAPGEIQGRQGGSLSEHVHVLPAATRSMSRSYSAGREDFDFASLSASGSRSAASLVTEAQSAPLLLLAVQFIGYNPTYDYRCIIQTLLNGKRERHLVLTGRSRPDWVTSMRVPGPRDVHIALQTTVRGEGEWMLATQLDLTAADTAVFFAAKGDDESSLTTKRFSLDWEQARGLEVCLTMGEAAHAPSSSSSNPASAQRRDIAPMLLLTRAPPPPADDEPAATAAAAVVSGVAKSSSYVGGAAAAAAAADGESGESVGAAAATKKNAAPKMNQADMATVLRFWEALGSRQEQAMEFLSERLSYLHPRAPKAVGLCGRHFQDAITELLNGAVFEALKEHSELVESGRWHPLRTLLEASLEHRQQGWIARFCERGVDLELWKRMGELLVDTMSLYAGLATEHQAALCSFCDIFVLKKAEKNLIDLVRTYKNPEHAELLLQAWRGCRASKREMGTFFYKTLFGRHPGVAVVFARTNMDSLAQHLFDAVQVLVESFSRLEAVRPVLEHLAGIHAVLGFDSSAYGAVGEILLHTLSVYMPAWKGTDADSELVRALFPKLYVRVADLIVLPRLLQEKVLAEAFAFIQEVGRELAWQPSYMERRKEEISEEVAARGTYSHTQEELVHGARVAWRNTFACPGRSEWKTLEVRDCRHAVTPEDIISELFASQKAALRRRGISLNITISRQVEPGKECEMIRFWNGRLLQYACYMDDDGATMGDPNNLNLTAAIVALGWVPPSPRSGFDVLPLVLETFDGRIYLFEVPSVDRCEVEVMPPGGSGGGNPRFKAMKSPSTPMHLGFSLRIGGVTYGCCAFNKRAVATQVADELMRSIARDESDSALRGHSFVEDRLKLELAEAAVRSFRKTLGEGALLDHRAVLARLHAHERDESAASRVCPVTHNWPGEALGEGGRARLESTGPRGASARFVRQAPMWLIHGRKDNSYSPRNTAARPGNKVVVLYGTETGTARTFAYRVARALQPLPIAVAAMNTLSPAALKEDKDLLLVLFVCSTVGPGEVPQMAKAFVADLKALGPAGLSGVRFAVAGLGSTTYLNFCKGPSTLAMALSAAGATAVVAMHKADSNGYQADTIDKWIRKVANVLGVTPNIGTQIGDAGAERGMTVEMLSDADPLVVGAEKAGASHFIAAGYQQCTVVRNELLNVPGVDAEGLPIATGAISAPPAAVTTVTSVTNVTNPTPSASPLTPAPRKVVPSHREVRLLEIDVIGKGFTFGPGDHVLIQPQNPPEQAQQMCVYLDVSPNQWFNVVMSNSIQASALFPLPMNVSTLFTSVLDLSLTIGVLPGLLRALLFAASDTEEVQALQTWLDRLADPERQISAQEHILRTFTSVPQLLAAYPSVRLRLGTLIETLPTLRPRFYSVASSATALESRLQLVVGVLRGTESGAPCDGQCSSYVAGLKAKVDTITMRFVPFFDAKLPLKATGPIIIATAGTGFAPFRAFFQERERSKNKAPNPLLTTTTNTLTTSTTTTVTNDGTGNNNNNNQQQQQQQQGAPNNNSNNTNNNGTTNSSVNTNNNSNNTNNNGKCIVYYGCRRENDILFHSELNRWMEKGVISDLRVALSRSNSAPRQYVQDLMRADGERLWPLLADPGCCFCFVGDSKMGDEVLGTLREIAIARGMTYSDFVDFTDKMREEGRIYYEPWGVRMHFTQANAEFLEARTQQAKAWNESARPDANAENSSSEEVSETRTKEGMAAAGDMVYVTDSDSEDGEKTAACTSVSSDYPRRRRRGTCDNTGSCQCQ